VAQVSCPALPPEPGVGPAAPEPLVLPTLFSEGYGLYRSHRSTFVLSYLAHIVPAGLLLAAGRFLTTHHQEIRQQVISIATEVSPYNILPASKTEAGGGGGGGDRDKLAASKGALPRSTGTAGGHDPQ